RFPVYTSVHSLSVRDAVGHTITGNLTGVVGKPSLFFFGALGGRGPYSWSLLPSDTMLPDWLNFDADGRLTGTPSDPGTWNLRVMEIDSGLSVAGVTVIPPTLAIRTFRLTAGGE